ncbi:hypothetical protein JCM11641_008425 [Rhodosporidiobolus odoratus]
MSSDTDDTPVLRSAEPPLKLRQSVDASEVALLHLPVVRALFPPAADSYLKEVSLDPDDAVRAGLVLLDGRHRWLSLLRLVDEAAQAEAVAGAEAEADVTEKVDHVYVRIYHAHVLQHAETLNRLIHGNNLRHLLASIPHKPGLRAYLAHHLRGRAQPSLRSPLANPSGNKAFYAFVHEHARTTLFSQALQSSDLLSDSLAYQTTNALAALLGQGLKDGCIFGTLADNLQAALTRARGPGGIIHLRALFGRKMPPNLRNLEKAKDPQLAQKRQEAEEAAAEAMPKVIKRLRELQKADLAPACSPEADSSNPGTATTRLVFALHALLLQPLSMALLTLVQTHQSDFKLSPRLAGWSDTVLVLCAFMNPEIYSQHLKRRRNLAEPVGPYFETTTVAQAFIELLVDVLVAQCSAQHAKHSAIDNSYLFLPASHAEPTTFRPLISSYSPPSYFPWFSPTMSRVVLPALVKLEKAVQSPTAFFSSFAEALASHPPAATAVQAFQPPRAAAIVRGVLPPTNVTLPQSGVPTSLQKGVLQALAPPPAPLTDSDLTDPEMDNDNDNEDDDELDDNDDERGDGNGCKWREGGCRQGRARCKCG